MPAAARTRLYTTLTSAFVLQRALDFVRFIIMANKHMTMYSAALQRSSTTGGFKGTVRPGGMLPTGLCACPLAPNEIFGECNSTFGKKISDYNVDCWIM